MALPVCLAISIVYRYAVVSEFGGNTILPLYLWQYPSYIGHYALGATLANFYVYGKAGADGRQKSSIPLLACIALVAVTEYAIGAMFSDSNLMMAFPGMLFAFEYALLIYSAITAPMGSLVRRIFTNGAATYLGRLSYSLYTWHLPIEIVLFGFGLPWIEWGVLSVAAALSVATASYYFVERPFLRLRSRFIGSRTVEPKAEELVRVPVPARPLNVPQRTGRRAIEKL